MDGNGVMFKCCICGKELTSSALWACEECCRRHELALVVTRWPAWAQSELARERQRRRFAPSYGVSGGMLTYAPYRRTTDNKTYRKVNGVRKDARSSRKRTQADNLLYSTDGSDDGRNYEGVLEGLPVDLRTMLSQRAEMLVLLRDAIASLPLISQRVLLGDLDGLSAKDVATIEGLSATTVTWLLQEAKQRLADLLQEKIGADDGMRFTEA
jgi:hypothetical protein